jgi:hypothetical protein
MQSTLAVAPLWQGNLKESAKTPCKPNKLQIERRRVIGFKIEGRRERERDSQYFTSSSSILLASAVNVCYLCQETKDLGRRI